MIIVMREGAPNTHIILFSHNTFSYPMKALADEAGFVDWSNASVGFHFYGHSSTERLEEVMEQHGMSNAHKFKILDILETQGEEIIEIIKCINDHKVLKEENNG